jgi:hypothetical protein
LKNDKLANELLTLVEDARKAAEKHVVGGNYCNDKICFELGYLRQSVLSLAQRLQRGDEVGE